MARKSTRRATRRAPAPPSARGGKRGARGSDPPGFGEHLGRALRRQHRACEAYRRLCRARGWTPAGPLQTVSDLARVPFLTTHAFKRSTGLYPRLVNGPPDSVEAWTSSACTTGDPSLVGRSRTDLEESRRALVEFGQQYGLLARDVALLFFPSPSELRRGTERLEGRPVDSHLAQMLEHLGGARKRRFLLGARSEVEGPKGALLPRVAGHFGGAVALACERHQSIFIGGFAAGVAPSLEALQAAGFRSFLPPGGILMLAGGGWDGRKGGVLAAAAPISKKALADSASAVLGLRQRQVVDLYGLAESPAWFAGHFSAEDEDFLYHSPDWARVLIRDPNTLEPVLEPGRPGLVEVLTWRGVESYPGAAILVDDQAQWSERPRCPICRRPGPLFRILGRASPHQTAAFASLASELADL